MHGDHQRLRQRAERLAAAAAALKQPGAKGAPFRLAFLTDRRRIGNPEPILEALPAGSAVIHRDYDDPDRKALARRYASICRAHRVLFLVGVDLDLARALSADGVHLPSRLLCGAPHDNFLITASCHDAEELRRAHGAGADIAFLGPAFATESHPNAGFLGVDRFKKLAASSPLPVLALGGVNADNAHLLRGPNVAGLGAIGAFADVA